MNKRIKLRWLKALRSGDYHQGTAGLRTNDMYCCLGVLCDLHSQAAFVGWALDEESGVYLYMGESIALPAEVCDWAGLAAADPALSGVALSSHNDGRRKSFRQLALLIERRL